MTDFEREELLRVPAWQDVLSHYAGAEAAMAAVADGKERWVPRPVAIEEVSTEELPRIHGWLLALGLLKCEIRDREVGLCYRPTPAGIRMLSSPAADEDE